MILRVQIEPLLEAIRALGWPLLMIDGVEADDVIGTLAKHAETRGAKTVISTGDKDLTQLVTPHVTLINTMSNETLDEAGVLAKFGVEPARIVDYLSLVGDSVDNVPGVEKVGPKTAVKWLSQYQTLDNVIANAKRNRWRRRRKFAQSARLVAASATIADREVRCRFAVRLE